jgi:hypothetical protein
LHVDRNRGTLQIADADANTLRIRIPQSQWSEFVT